MLILRLNENKELNSTKTSSNFTGENNFEKIRIVADNTVGDKQLQDLKTELYIYNIIDDDWTTFNDCVPVEWTEENDKLIFEVPVKGQYTVFPQLGMYLRFSDGNSLIGKTNVVKTMILHHKDNNIDTSSSIELFEQYKNNSIKLFEEQKNRLANMVDSVKIPETRIYFKKNCENWTTPRVHLFNNEYWDGVPNLYNTFFPWQWNESPYMIQDESDETLYYIDLPITKYKYIIFFCDELAGSLNFKTNNLIIPSSVQYPSLCYWQSPIGYDGIWIDKNKETFPLYLQSYASNCSVTVDGNVLTGQSLGNIGIAITEDTYSLYTKFEIPLTAEKIQVAISDLTKEYFAYELCYNVPVIYRNSWEVETPSIEVFDGTTDSEFMFETRYSNREYALYRDIYKNFSINSNKVETGQVDSIIYDKNFDVCSNINMDASYFKNGRLCHISGKICFYDGKMTVPSYFVLPFTPSTHSESTFIYNTINREPNTDSYFCFIVEPFNSYATFKCIDQPRLVGFENSHGEEFYFSLTYITQQ